MFIQADITLSSIISGFSRLSTEELNTVIDSARYVLDSRESPELINKVKEMCQAGDYIPAVRYVRLEFNCGLKVAKQHVDKIREEVKTSN